MEGLYKFDRVQNSCDCWSGKIVLQFGSANGVALFEPFASSLAPVAYSCQSSINELE